MKIKNVFPISLLISGFIFSAFAGVHGYDMSLVLRTSDNEPDAVNIAASATGEIRTLLIATLTNIGDEASPPGSLLVVLPSGDHVESVSLFRTESGLIYRSAISSTTNRWFDVEALSPGRAVSAYFIITYFAERFPFTYNPDNPSAVQCSNVHTEGYFWSRDGIEYEEFAENTNYCKHGGTLDIDLEIEKNAFVDCENETIRYILRYCNIGSSTAHDVFVTDLLPAGATFRSSVPPPINPVSVPLSWNIGTVNAGECDSIILVVRIDAAGAEWTNSAWISSATDADNYLTNNSTQITNTCDTCFNLRGSIEVSPSRIVCRDSFEIEFAVRNAGNIDAVNVVAQVDITNPEAAGLRSHYSWNIGTLRGGQSYRWSISSISPDEPQDAFWSGITIRLSITPTVGDCDSSNNTVVKNVEYFCDVCAGAGVWPSIITPDGDGFNDEAVFGPPVISKVVIYDARGYRVRTLLPPEVFDGKDDDGRRLPSGVYVFQIFCPLSEEKPVKSATIAIQR